MAGVSGSSVTSSESYIGADTRLRFAMVGMTGTGKSALGNSILAWGLLAFGQVWTAITKKPFKSEKNPKSVTVNCSRRDAVVRGRKIAIVDTPGFYDTAKTQDETVKEIIKCVRLLKPGPHAILLVVKVDRFTPEVVKGIEQMKKIFGKQSIKFLIIVFTQVDQLDADQTLEQFVKQITGTPQKLLEDCNMRYVGFNNKCEPTSDENGQQVDTLIAMAETIANDNGGQCYNVNLEESYIIRAIKEAYKDAKEACTIL